MTVTARVVTDSGIDPAAAAAVLGTTPMAELAAGEIAGDEPEPEESIYETMKRNMRAKQDELDAQNAQWQQQRRVGGGSAGGPGGAGGPGRPGPVRPPAQRPGPAAPVIEVVQDVTNLAVVWQAARHYLAANARLLESVLGGCTQLHALTTATMPPEVTLQIPHSQERFTNDKARAKLEEALRTVTGLPLRLRVEFIERPSGDAGPSGMGVNLPPGSIPPGGGIAAQRIPPELMDAVKKQPIVQELMKRFDATVTQVEMLGTQEE